LKRKCWLSSEWLKPRTPSVISVRSYGCEKNEPETYAAVLVVISASGFYR